MDSKGRTPDQIRAVESAHMDVQPTAENLDIAPMLGALDAVDDGVLIVDAHWRITYLNSAAVLLCGVSSQRAVGRPLDAVLRVLNEYGDEVFAPSHRANLPFATAQENLTLATAAHEEPVRRVCVALTPTPMAGAGQPGVTIVVSDRSRESGLERRLAHQASHDALTNLPNRSAFEQCVGKALHACQENDGIECAVLYLDVDQFKVINATCGHAAGDFFIRQLAAALRDRVRGSDILARLGGDEFGVLLHGCTVEHALAVAKELRNLVKKMVYTWEEQSYNHTVSIGVAPIHGNKQTVAAILSAADVACFAAKDRGRDRVEDYRHESVPERQMEMQWVSRVARACDEERFVLYQQPIVPLHDDTGDRAHYELLLRMVDRFGQLIMPGNFICAAERYNLMPRIDRWAVRHTLTNLLWRPESAPQAPYTLSVNLSGTSLSDPAFLDFVIGQLDAAPIEPGTLCFEITETAAIANIGQVARFMRELRERGCLFSLDDFGSGLSSFAYLKELPVDFLKIDGLFIRQLLSDEASGAVVKAFNDIGHALNIRTVAERVEDVQTARKLADLGVDYGQGFYFARPRKLRNPRMFPHPPAIDRGVKVAV